jgi:hypothetical protein
VSDSSMQCLGYGLDDRGIEVRFSSGARFIHSVQTGPWPIEPPAKCYRGRLGGPGPEAEHSTSYTEEVTN